MFKYHSDVGKWFLKKKVKKKKNIFFFTFLNWENQTWYWGKRWLFLIGNGAEIQPLEMGRKCPVMSCDKNISMKVSTIFYRHKSLHKLG